MGRKNHKQRIAKLAHRVRAKNTEKKVLAALREILLERKTSKSQKKLTMVEVAERAGVHRSTLYRYYRHFF